MDYPWASEGLVYTNVPWGDGKFYLMANKPQNCFLRQGSQGWETLAALSVHVHPCQGQMPDSLSQRAMLYHELTPGNTPPQNLQGGSLSKCTRCSLMKEIASAIDASTGRQGSGLEVYRAQTRTSMFSHDNDGLRHYHLG